MKKLLLAFLLMFSFLVSACSDDGDKEPEATPFEFTDDYFSLQGFAGTEGAVTMPDIDENDSTYVKVSNEAEYLQALMNARTIRDADGVVTTASTVRVIEITADLNLGYTEVYEEYGDTVTGLSSITEHNPALAHPILMETGVSKINIDYTEDLMIFSKTGITIKHAAHIVKRTSNLVIRNIQFDEIWEWDEGNLDNGDTPGDWDINDWDYFTIDSESNGVWIDHCTFGKAYDGTVDLKGGSSNLSITWSLFKTAADGSDDFVNAQFTYLENEYQTYMADKENLDATYAANLAAYEQYLVDKAEYDALSTEDQALTTEPTLVEEPTNPCAYPEYSALRDSGVKAEDFVLIFGSQKKGHLIGSSSFKDGNEDLSITLAYNVYYDLQDRLPRLREGNAHVYNVVLDATNIEIAREKIASDYSTVAETTGYKFQVISQAAVSTEGGALMIENSHLIGVAQPIKDNQKSSSNYSEYTGKFSFVNTIYTFGGETVNIDSDQEDTPFVGNHDNPEAFSWNYFKVLPYEYNLIPVEDIYDLLTATGNSVGAGSMTWTNEWLQGTYTA